MRRVYIDCTADNEAMIAEFPADLTAGLEIFIGDPDPDELARRCAGAAGIVNGHSGLPNDLLGRLTPTLKLVVFAGIGASSYIDLAQAAGLGIVVRTVPGYGDRTIAEHSFALLLAAARRVARMDRRLRAGGWGADMGVELQGKTLGVVGTGGVGRQMIAMAAGFGMAVAAWSRGGVDPALPCRPVTLDQLFAESDAVSLHLALTDETRGMIGRDLLGRLKPGALLVNTARGALLDEAALVDALRSGAIAEAALDVFIEEPLPLDSPLRGLDNVTLTSHAAWKTPEASRRLLLRSLEELRDGLNLVQD